MSIEEIKRQYEKEWLALHGVHSVGIGLNKNGEKIIKIGIEHGSVTQGEEIPANVGGYTVELYVSGKIKTGI